jgi:hypothetical protein
VWNMWPSALVRGALHEASGGPDGTKAPIGHRGDRRCDAAITDDLLCAGLSARDGPPTLRVWNRCAASPGPAE